MSLNRYVTVIILLFLLIACNPSAETITPITTIEVTATAIPPTATPVPLSNKVWVVLGGGLPESTIRTVVEEADRLTKEAGLTLEQKPQLDPAELADKVDEIKIIIVLPPDPGIQQLAEQYPQIRFISIGLEGLTDRENLYTSTSAGNHPEWEGFLGGYISALVTNEWRIGMLTLSGSEDGAAAADGFVNGGVFYCGLCNPIFPPFVDYPYTLSINQNAPQSEWQAAADNLIASGVSTVYVYPSVANPELLAYLAQNGLRIISGEPVIEQIRPAYLATIQQSSGNALASALTDAIAGNTPADYTSKMVVSPVDSGLVSDGKMRLINQIITDLQNGTIRAATEE